MNKLTHTLKKLGHTAKKHWIITGVIVLVILGVIIFSQGNTVANIVTAQIGTIEEEILATGQTVARSSVTLGFERSGKVALDNIEVGSRVKEGDTLVVLEQADLLSDLRKAEANLNKALVELDSTRRTSSLSHSSAEDALIDNIKNAFIQADDATRNEADKFFDNPGLSNTYFNPSIVDTNTTYLFGLSQNIKNDITAERVALEQALNDWEMSLNSIDNNGTNLGTAFTLAQENLRKTQKFLDKVAVAINSLSSYDFAYDTTVAGYKTTIASARADIVSALSNLITAKEKFDNAPYAVIGLGGVYDDVLSEEARIESLRAEVAAIRASLDKTVLRAPISGVVTKADAKRGEIVTSGTGLIAIISDDDLRVEANVSEISIGKVLEGDETVVVFDAFPGKTFKGKVTYIDPAEVAVDGVPTYKVTSVFTETLPTEVRSGLTANLTVLTDRRDNVVKIPTYAIDRRADGNFVKVRTGKGDETVEKEVTLGLQGKDGSIEITTGLSGGEEILADI